MISYEKLKTPDEVHSALNAFEVCFPHLKEKVSDMWQFACKLSQKAEVYVGYDGERLVGISCFYCNDADTKTGYITLIGVLPDFRGAGYGKGVLDFTACVMRENGMKSVRLEVDNDNIGAQKFYLRQGFVMEAQKESSSYMIMPL